VNLISWIEDKWEVKITSLSPSEVKFFKVFFLHHFQLGKFIIIGANNLILQWTIGRRNMEDIEFVFQPIILPKNGFTTIEKDILKNIGLLDFATQVNWEGKILKEVLQEVLLNLQVEAKTSMLNGKNCELIPKNFRELFTKKFYFQTSPILTNKKCTHQLVISRSSTSKCAITRKSTSFGGRTLEGSCSQIQDKKSTLRMLGKATMFVLCKKLKIK